MEKSLFIVGYFVYYPTIEWRFHSYFLTEEELLTEVSSDDFNQKADYMFRRSMRTVRDNVFVCQFDQMSGKILRDDLLDKIAELINSRLPGNYLKCGYINSPSEIELVDMDLSVRALNVLKERKIPTLQVLAERTVNNHGKTFIPIKAKNAGKKTNGEFKLLLTYYRLLKTKFPGRHAFC